MLLLSLGLLIWVVFDGLVPELREFSSGNLWSAVAIIGIVAVLAGCLVPAARYRNPNRLRKSLKVCLSVTVGLFVVAYSFTFLLALNSTGGAG